MRPCFNALQRRLGGPFHTSTILRAASSVTRSAKSGPTRRALSSAAAATAVEIDGEIFMPTEYAYSGATRVSSRRRRTPVQLSADLNEFSASASSSSKKVAAAGAVNPVDLLLKKHQMLGGGGDDDDGNDGGHGGSSSGRGAGRGKAKRVPLAPPTKAETASASVNAARTRNGSDTKQLEKKTVKYAAAALNEEDGRDNEASTTASFSSCASATDVAFADNSDYQKSLQILTNPFRGLHSDVARSYRIDQLLEGATPDDILLARQERKSAAFSFLRFKAGEELYKNHWESLPEMQQHLNSILQASTPILGSCSSSSSKSSAAAVPYVRGTPIPGLTLFNNDLGLQNPTVQCSYPLILAQRMLLFPDHLRQFHSICGREDVPCDFFADIDLPGESTAGAEKALLEVLNYLEVRLPGVGFTDPFFLVLTNAVPSKDKVSYHVHARSMTYLQERKQRAGHGIGLNDGDRRTSVSERKKAKKSSAASDGDDDAGLERDVDDDYDDLSDMVNVVDSNGSVGKKHTSGPTKLIAFQDYRTVKLVGDEVNQTLGRDVIDTNCYRPNGMLRCAFSSKLPSTQDHDFYSQKRDGHGAAAAATRKRLIPLVTARDSALQKRLSEMESVLRTMTDPEILELTFCTRHMDREVKVQRLVHERAKQLVIVDSHAPTGSAAHVRNAEVLQATLKHRWKLIRPRHILGPQATQAVEYDAYGNVVSPFLTEGAKWRRYKAVTAKLRKLPLRAAESYDVWVRVGLALHNFSNEDNCFEEWVLFSLKSPQKYSREVCRKKWMQFERNPDALNWRRGYNYLNSTVWRQV